VIDEYGSENLYPEILLKVLPNESLSNEYKHAFIEVYNEYIEKKNAQLELKKMKISYENHEKEYERKLLDLYNLGKEKRVSIEEFCDIFQQNLRSVVADKLESEGYTLTYSEKEPKNSLLYSISVYRELKINFQKMKKNHDVTKITPENVLEDYHKENLRLYTRLISSNLKQTSNSYFMRDLKNQPFLVHEIIWKFDERFLTQEFAEQLAKSIRLTPIQK
jgi:hypothetical protein